MDPFELLNTNPRQRQYIEHEFSTPPDPSLSPFPPGSDATEEDSPARTIKADKERRFLKYMFLKDTRGHASRHSRCEDADDFYNDNINESQENVAYFKDSYPRTTNSSDLGIEVSVLNAYDIFDVHIPHKLHDFDPESCMNELNYDDALSFKEIRHLEVSRFQSMRYKNNLVESYQDYLFIASKYRILVFKDELQVKTIDVTPSFTTVRHRSAATWSSSPHTINYLKVSKLAGRSVLSCAIDDGRVLIYDIHDFFIKSTHSVPKYELKLSSSVWGVDTYRNMVAVSDNSQTVTLFLFEESGIYHCTSNQIIHNIPTVSFVDIDERNTVYVSCVSISGEFIIFKFETFTNVGPVAQPPDEYSLSIDIVDVLLPMFSKYEFRCTILSRTVLQEDAWATHFIDDKYFKEVTTPDYLGSANYIDVEKILLYSKELNLMSDHLLTSDLGGGAWFEEIGIETPSQRGTATENRLNRFTDKFSRIRKLYFSTSFDEALSPIPKSPYHDKFLFVATASKIGLYRFGNLVCNATSDRLFSYRLSQDLRFSNRLSITKVIPELSAVIVASQAGFFAIFRLVKHRGLHTMRIEHLIPRPQVQPDETIIGLGVYRADERSFWIYVTFSDGHIKVYELTNRDEPSLITDAMM